MQKLLKTAVVTVVVGTLSLTGLAAADAKTTGPSVSVTSVNGAKASKAAKAKRGPLTVVGRSSGLPALTVDAGDSVAVRAGEKVRVAATPHNGVGPFRYQWSVGGDAKRFVASTSPTTAFDTSGLPTGVVPIDVTVTDSRGARATSTVREFVGAPSVTTLKHDAEIGPGLDAVLGSQARDEVGFSVTSNVASTDLTLDWDDPNPLAGPAPAVSDLDLTVKDPKHEHEDDTSGSTQNRPERLHFDNPTPGKWTAVIDDYLSGPVTYHLTVAHTTYPASPVPKINAGGPYRFVGDRAQELRATVTGGTAPYTVRWDRDGDGDFDATGLTTTSKFGLGVHLVTAIVTDARGYTVRQTVPVRVVQPGDNGHTSPYVVIAVNDTGINPYHLDWAASTYPDAGVLRDTDNFTRDPATYIDGYPANTPALPVHLGQGYKPAVDDDLWADKGDASRIQVGKLYWIPGTKIIGAIDSGGDNGITGQLDAPSRILDTNGHGTASASVAAGNLYGSCPRCLLVVDKGLGDDWSYSRPWIDIVSNSYSPPANIGVPIHGFSAMPVVAAERGQLGLYAAGNGNDDGFFTPEQTYTSAETGPDWIIRVGAVNRSSRQPFLGTGKPVTVSSFGLGDIPAADFVTVDGEVQHSGTSSATPISAGVFGTTLGAGRAAMGDASTGQRGGLGVIGRGDPVASSRYLRDGVLTRSELVEAVVGTARHGAEPPTVGVPEEIPANPLQYAVEGYGILDNESAVRAINALVRNGPLEPVSADEAAFFATDSALRVKLWGKWAGGGVNSAHPSGAAAARSAARLGDALQGTDRRSVTTFANALNVLENARAAAGGKLRPASTPGATPQRVPSITITSPGQGEVAKRPGGAIGVSGVASFPPSSLPATPARYFLRRDDCGSADPADDNPHLSRKEDKDGSDAGNGCGQVFQDLAATGVLEFGEDYPLEAGDLPVVLGSGHNVRGSIQLESTGADPAHEITVELVDGTELIGSQDVTAGVIGVPGVSSGKFSFPFSFPVPDAQVGKLHANLALRVITRQSTSLATGTITTGSYVDIPRAAGVLPAGAAVEVSLDDAKFARPVRAPIAIDGTWLASVNASAARAGAHRIYARLVVGHPVASAEVPVTFVAPSGPGAIEVSILPARGDQSVAVVAASDLSGDGTFAKWSAGFDTSKLAPGRYRIVLRMLQSGVEVAKPRVLQLTLR